MSLTNTLPAFWHSSMYGFNASDHSGPGGSDNRPVAPLMAMTFDQWWFHGHMDQPPPPGEFYELRPGQPATAELACDKGQTSYWNTSDGHTDLRDGNNPCRDTSFPSGSMHTTGFDDLTGCALAIAYESDASKIQPEDFTVFSVNQTCVWSRLTDFQVPDRMPACPEEGCHCAWFWIHSVSRLAWCTPQSRLTSGRDYSLIVAESRVSDAFDHVLWHCEDDLHIHAQTT